MRVIVVLGHGRFNIFYRTYLNPSKSAVASVVYKSGNMSEEEPMAHIFMDNKKVQNEVGNWMLHSY